jgi:ABC-type multidrug transport system ATPase subunit
VDLTVECDHQVVLRNVDLELGARGLYALIGGSGAGKSALLGVLSGRNRAASGWQLEGSIWYCNLPLGATTRPAVLTATVSRPSLSLRGYLLADLDELAADSASNGFLLDLLDRVALSALAPYLSETLGGPRLHLSTAEWRRIAIARELAASPPLLCVDDAFVGLDAENSAVLRSVLLSAARERAVLFTGSVLPPGLPLVQTFQLREGQLLQRDGEERPSAVKVNSDGPGKPVRGPSQTSEATAAPRVAPLANPGSPGRSSGAGEDGVPAATSRPRVQQGSAPGGPPRKGPDAVIWSSTAPILRLRNFGILASGRPVLVGVNLDLPDCGLHLLIGRDGSQRRMLLRALCGPRGGQLQCTGDALFGGGALSEEHGLTTLLPNPRMAMLTAREHLMQGPSPWQASARQERSLRPLRLLEQAGFPELATLLDTPLYDLGTYERRIIEILASVACSPLALALQDILSGVETALQPRLLRLLADQSARRAILLFTEEPQPYMAFAFTPPACVAWLSNDRILAEPPE